MAKLRVGVLRGGPSSEYEVSLQSGDAVLRYLDPERYHGHDIYVDRRGVWHSNGLEREPGHVVKHLDVVWNALHGEYGEDGTVQRVLDRFGVPYVGSRSLASSLAMSKHAAKRHLYWRGIKTPTAKLVAAGGDAVTAAKALFASFPVPMIIKPANCGSSVGVSVARDFSGIVEGIRTAHEYSPSVLVEEFILGREATCGVIDGFRGEELYTLPPVEILPPDTHEVFSYDVKYNGASQEICPGRFTHDEKRELQNVARAVHRLLGLRHYSRSDFIVSPRRGIYWLEVNTLPGLTAESLFPKSLAAVGSSITEFLDHAITRAVARV